MADEDNPQPDECFIVGVIGKDGSEQRIHADWFIDGIVIPVFKEHFPTFRVLRADRMNTPGMITSQIIEKLLEAKLVIADMTFLNANAFYEIGIRHMTGLPIIHAHRDGDPIPFDVSTFLSMPYSLTQHQSVMAAQAALKVLVENVLKDGYKVDNPVTQARGRAKFDETATAPDKVLLSQIEALSARVAAMEVPRNALGYGTSGFGTARFAPIPANFPQKFAGGGPARPTQTSLIFSRREGTHPKALEGFLETILRGYLGEEVQLTSETEDQLEITYPAGSMSHTWIEQLVSEAEQRGLRALPF